MNAATVDEISGGRLILGIGTSGKNVVEGFHGRAFQKPLTQLRDVIRVTRTLLSGRRLHESDAKLVEYRPFQLAMNPVRDDIPIYVAALKQRSITSIGEMADGWIPTFWPYEELSRGHAWIAEGAAKAGRDPAEITTAPFTTVLPLPGEMATQKAREIIAFYIGGMGAYYKELLTGFGFGEACEQVDTLYKDRATRRQAADAVPSEMLEALMVAGDPDFCIGELERRRGFGIDLPILNLPNDMPWQMVEMFIRLMAPKQPST
jgi:alkanesulfonate monooxygenase SsuD/methylene tetrahydromethanopterin reductase-like flavin-dependent oxidoreductase (luciferase family)